MAVIASVVLLPHMHALVVSRQIRLADKLPIAVAHRARERILAILVMRLEMGLVVIAPAKQFAAPLDLALVVGVLLGGEFARLWPRAPVHPVVRQHILLVRSWLPGGHGWVYAVLQSIFGPGHRAGRSIGQIAGAACCAAVAADLHRHGRAGMR